VVTRALVPAVALLGAIAASFDSPRTATAARLAQDRDAAFASFFNASTPDEIAAASNRIAASGAGFDEAFRRLRAGRVYSRDVPRGVVQGSYRSGGVEYFYTLEVPDSYDPAKKYQVRVQLHGGVGRIETSAPPRPGAGGRLAGAEQIYVMPYAWRDAPWWSRRQIDNLRAILDRVKRSYNVDENRVVLSGISDGGTGVYYAAMRDTTPFASFLPLNGFIMVLRNETAESDGDLFPNNLVGKPLFVVNGGRDPLYPASVVEPFVDHLKKGGVALEYRPQPDAGHDTSWWPDVKDSFEGFVTAHPRTPLPDTLSWESGTVPSRAHWLVIDRLGPGRADDPTLPDVNARATPPAPEFGIRAVGTGINRVLNGSNAQQIGLRSGDIVAAINNQPANDGMDVAGMLAEFPPGRPLLLTVRRGDQAIRLTGRYAPTVIAGEASMMFPPAAPSGRVDLARTGNRVEARTRGVASFTLLLSPDQFDFSRPLTVVVNGRTVFEGAVQKSVTTLLTWAARDNDRTMLFAAELAVDAQR
jgi:PDZ domain-containing protein